MEIELKFQLNEQARHSIDAQLRAQGGKSKLLEAYYFDTVAGTLAQSGFSLRLRKEGRAWFQTLKSARSAASAVRAEHNVRLQVKAQSQPQLDPVLHAETEEGVRLQRLLSHSADNTLAYRYATHIRRLSVQIGARNRIEYSLDNGEINAQPDSNVSPLALPVCELEIELVSGPVRGLLSAARKLLGNPGVCIDVRSKAQRGGALVDGSLIVSPARATRLNANGSSLKALVEAVLSNCAQQVLVNASQLVSIEGGGPEHVHQLRVGLRRLRSAIALFGKFVGSDIATWDAKAKQFAAGLGGNRDIDVMAERHWPRLRAAGAPLVELPVHDNVLPPGDLIRDAGMQQWMLELLAVELQGLGEVTEGEWRLVLPVIRGWIRQCKKDALRFESFDFEQRHRLRKRLKRLRYALEFIESELPSKAYKRYSKALTNVLNDLGDYNDLRVAIEAYRDISEVDPRAWFAIGWLMAQMPKAERRCIKALAVFHSARDPCNLDR
jgi:inorganic triphosphatase YgiF